MTNWEQMAREAQEKASVAAKDAQERGRQLAEERLKEAQDRIREAQEAAAQLARQRAEEAQELARRASETMPRGMFVRLLSFVFGIPLLPLLVFAYGTGHYAGLPFTFATAVCATIGLFEYFRGLRYRGYAPIDIPAYVAVILLQFAAWNVSRGELINFIPVILAVSTIGTTIYAILRKNKEPLVNISLTIFGVVYVGWLFSYLVFLRSLPGVVSMPLPFGGHLPEAARGAWLVLYVFAVTWGADAGAYFAGIRWGRTPLAPRLSPKKTVEGAVGGIITAMVMSVLWGTWIGLPWMHCLILGPILGALGEVGDLAESALKRDLGIKDFGGILPGHGGVLDRFDSLLFSAPVAYYYLVFVVKHLH